MKKMLVDKTQNIREAMNIIANRMIQTRPRAELVYYPYRKSNVYRECGILGEMSVDLKKLYPEAKPGNVVYVGTVLEAIEEYEIVLVLTGNVKVIYNEETVYDYKEKIENNGRCNIKLKKGANPVLFIAKCDNEESFRFGFKPTTPAYTFMWAKDYLFHVRATSPIEYFRLEDGIGISKLYECEVDFDGEYIFPQICDDKYVIDFNLSYGDKNGMCAYALTYAMEDTNITIKPFSKSKLIVNGLEIEAKSTYAKKGDTIIVKSLRGEKWGFSYNEDALIEIPFLESNRQGGDKWLILGSFGKGEEFDNVYGPEIDIQFNRPYITSSWEKTFWKLSNKNDYIRPYVESCFYSQWFYALMVGHYGLLKAAEALDNREYKEYFIDSMRNLSSFFEYMSYEYKEFGQPTFIQKGMRLDDLDSIGTMGMNMCELYKLYPGAEVMSCIEKLENAMRENIPRFEDGTFCRPRDMWADDTFMSCPFLVRLGLLKQNEEYFEEVIRQISGFAKKLWIEEKKLFSHIFFKENNIANKVTWGRGNGWVFVTLSDVLENIPEDYKGREKLLELFRAFAQGLAENQDKSGLWHQVLTREDSYLETSCSAMFIIGFCRGIKNGWLDEKYIQNVKKAYEGLIALKIDDEGNIYDVCKGSSNSMGEDYYINLGVIKNDDHGTGIILTAFAEMLELLG